MTNDNEKESLLVPDVGPGYSLEGATYASPG